MQQFNIVVLGGEFYFSYFPKMQRSHDVAAGGVGKSALTGKSPILLLTDIISKITRSPLHTRRIY